MNRLFAFVITAMLTIGISARDYHIIPQPKDIQDREGQFTLTQGMKIFAQGEANRKVATFFVDKLNRSTGLGLSLTNKKGQAQIQLLTNNKITGKEAYRLTVSPKQVVAEASTDQGLFYAMQTFLQMLPPEVEIACSKAHTQSSMVNRQSSMVNSHWSAPCAVINDEPRFEYRSFMLEPCRHFFTIDEIKKQIDIMSMYKANNMHFHLTEDQGWRVEIKKYPRLTEVGATAIGRPNTADGSAGASRYYYTQDELRDLVAYAKERFINIIPEFEMPGHELAAIAAYPWLSCRDLQVKPRSAWGVEPIIMCAGKETTFQFLQDVVDELVQIFPSKYFHIGGDEAPRNEWKSCPLCQKRADDLGFKNENGRSREAQLQSYVVTRMEKYLNDYGRSIIGWDEILEGGNLNKSAIVMSWRGTQGGIQAAKAGHKAIMSPSSDGYYLDYYEGDCSLEPVAASYAGRVPLSKTYNYEPISSELEGELEKYILGPQGNIWTEYIPNTSVLELRAYPRLLAIMETGWTQRTQKNYDDFCRRLDTDSYVRLHAHGANFNVPMPEQPGGSCDYVAFTDEAVLTFQTSRPETMYYTLDGSEPTAQSTLYTEPIKLRDNATLKIATLLPSGIKSPTRTIKVEKQALLPSLTPHSSPLNGQSSMVNGLLLRVFDGTYSSVAMLDDMMEWQTDTIKALTDIPRLNRSNNYSAIAEGFIDVPKDGVWFFRANYPAVWIDDSKVVDNTDRWVLDGLRGGCSIALAKGLHKIKVVFLGYNASGRPTYWDNGRVQWRHESESKYSNIEPASLSLP
ncbi:MAG: family 20 glycosylhydrolase [Bacteroidaceae bacterium]|nr:family 20 glycosylhydrolase [Bacteroidaceae bacterium]